MAVQVTPAKAKQGDYLESFTPEETGLRDEFCRQTEAFLAQQNIHDYNVVYTFMPEQGRKASRYNTWQVFIVNAK